MAKFRVEIVWSSCWEIDARNEEEVYEKITHLSWRETFEKMLASPDGIIEDIEVYEEAE